MRPFLTALLLLTPLAATTLRQLTLDEMTQKATAIVRGKAQQTSVETRSGVIYTHYKIQVSEQWKGAPSAQADLATPGGVQNGTSQRFGGVPTFDDGQDHIFFLWTSRTGLTQLIGLSQGMFNLAQAAAGPLVTRTASTATLLNASGNPVTDPGFTMPLTDFRDKVTRILSAKAGN